MVFDGVSRAAHKQHRQRQRARVFERMYLPAWNKNGVARFDFARLCADGHVSCPAQYVIDFFCFEMMMPPDLCADGHHFFGEAAALDGRSGAINERANLRTVRRVDYGSIAAFDNKHNDEKYAR